MALRIEHYQIVTRNWLNKHLGHLDGPCFCDHTCKSCYRLKVIRSE